VADVDHEHGPDFTAKDVEIGDVEADVLQGDRRVEMVRHDTLPSVVRWRDGNRSPSSVFESARRKACAKNRMAAFRREGMN
jgi:hypothetical protein